MTKDKALDLALEALSSIDIYLSDTLSGRVNPEPATYKQWLIDGIIEARNRSRAPITAIKQARSAPVQEPFGYFRYDLRLDAWVQSRDSNRGAAFYTTPPAAQRQWVGLTDEEMRELEKQFEAERVRTSDEEYLVIYPAAYWQWQRAIEAKLKEKNGWYRQHVTDGSPCWCEPEISYTNPETGASVIVHKEPQ